MSAFESNPALKFCGALLRPALVSLLAFVSVSTAAIARDDKAATSPSAETQQQVVPTVAAAASLRYALEEIAARYTKATGKHVKLTFGATGNLVHQIEAGAPFQVLFAADDKSVKKLAAGGNTDGEPVVFAQGELSVAAAKASPVAIDSELKGLREALAAGKVKSIAIANPETAPYGRAGREALEASGLLKEADPLIVTGENIGQTATFVSTGAADVGFIARSLAVSKELEPLINSASVNPEWYKPINHGMAVVKGASPDAKAFADFVRGPEGRGVLEANGFSVPKS
ncbi:Molybdenum ABC transporter, periplasmic molybdenum-binding protein ModA [Hyphomicrobium sulfonivorans]|uniref:Molybdenum ABC transporter, periplasmic molybdenum-binding protein ModA n=1 Tax=Hyphomicrobium sulfonivorans TaxID=121290 RepID=A0A109BKN2_HYPSL|nr:molybdate ABC transporter substrate-binding protein [Hyphomicrobium sulfonivorans]KWT70235.1 Molybdenum ABC transporter, periplasmic molybdenum-binding protein ModA [Hyphomicrobium sulfonivorans]